MFCLVLSQGQSQLEFLRLIRSSLEYLYSVDSGPLSS